MRMRRWLWVLAILVCGAAEARPRVETIPGGAGQPMDVQIHAPDAPSERPRAAIVLFHGGGWTVGEAAWMTPVADLATGVGMVAVSVEYRLSVPGGDVTPFDAVADARAALRWVRAHADALGIDPARIAAGGISAGGHLAAAIAALEEPFGDAVSARPDLLVLWSPAVAVSRDGWLRRLTGGPAQAATLSPDLHVHAGMPATVLLQGEEDSVTPAAGARAFCDRLRAVGSDCELHAYPGVGHLFTRNLEQQETPDYGAIDREIDADADARALAFLRARGFAD